MQGGYQPRGPPTGFGAPPTGHGQQQQHHPQPSYHHQQPQQQHGYQQQQQQQYQQPQQAQAQQPQQQQPYYQQQQHQQQQPTAPTPTPAPAPASTTTVPSSSAAPASTGSASGATCAALSSFDTQHEDMIHDAQLDYYGKRLATCSSDRTCKIFAVDSSTNSNTLLDVLYGHEGPVWQVAWAHPKFGPGLLATASYDTRVFLWQQQAASGKWLKVVEHTPHTASVNSIAWAPHEYGLVLACGSSDGKISVLTAKEDGTWDHVLFAGHSIGVNAVSWAPAAVPGSLLSSGNHATASPSSSAPAATSSSHVNTMRLASGGCDNRIRIWKLASSSSTPPTTSSSPSQQQSSTTTTTSSSWEEEYVLDGHTDWIRDVAWAPSIGLTATHLASCSQDKTVVIWTQSSPSKPFTKRPLVIKNPAAASSGVPDAAAGEQNPFTDVCWRVSWSPSGNILAVSCGDNKVTLWKENLDGVWQFIGDVKEEVS